MNVMKVHLRDFSTYPSIKMDNTTFIQEALFNLEDKYNNLSSAINTSFNVSEETIMNKGIDSVLGEAFESPTFRVFAFIAYLLIIPIGCTLLFLIIHYEQFGGDPQKRSIFNQIIGYMATIELVTAIVTEHIFIARILFGCLPSGLGTFFWFINGFKHATYTILIAIATTYKMIRTYSFRRIAGLNDDFLSLFFLMASVMNAFIFNFLQYMIGQPEAQTQFVIMTCGTEKLQMIQNNM